MIDWQGISDAIAPPERTWVTSGVVSGSDEADSEDACVDFSKGYPLVSVLAHPSLVPIRCKVAMRMAGRGEAEWHPFIVGDEVIVLIPGGDFRAGGVIVGKLNNELDTFPTESVAGQDPTKNNFAFRRTRTPVVEENAGPVLLRSALTGGMVSIDEVGAVTLRAGNVDDPTAPASALKLSSEVLGLQDPTGTRILQLNLENDTFTMRLKDTVLTLSSGDSPVGQSQLATPLQFQVSTSGQPSLEHVATTEAVFNIFIQSLLAFAAANPGPVTGGALATFLNTALGPLIATTVANGTLSAPVAAGIAAAFASAPQKATLPLQTRPGIGCVGFLAG